jgi:uncharacterized RDD family membrane protein YckC
MEPEKDNTPQQQNVKYVWDPEKLAWVEVSVTTIEDAPVEPAAEVRAEPLQEEAIIAEEAAPVEGVAAEVEAEAVTVQYRGTWSRLGAALVDWIALSIISIIIRIILGRVGHIAGIPVYVVLAYGLVYFVGFWWWRGQTPGKMLIGARVVRTDGRPLGVDRAFLRYLFYLAPIYTPIVFFANLITGWLTFALPIVGLVAIALSRQKRGIHDLIAGTCVISTRAPAVEPEEIETAELEEADESGNDTPKED